jgi:hypothetical protein
MGRRKRMSRSRYGAVAVVSLRIAYGAALVAIPTRMTTVWLGRGAAGAPVQVPVRGLGMREVVLHAGALEAALAGRPLRPWMAASILGDVTDIAATAAGRRELPPGVAGRTLLVAGLSAALSALVAVVEDA